ncbi:glutamate--tRNA ligase [Alphaproteobacteria bacterium]|nr:glutamate--tRNA ligase [Alphaproteobacteria bacterium]
MKVITRFAPSPTGYLHIGGARTALFNYLFAKKNNGKYLVRIEDTDIKRSTPEAVKAIHEGLDWLKIKSSEEIVYQSRQKNKHIDIAYKLLESHFAYKCYLNPDELNTLRVKSRENGVPIKSPWRDKVINDNSKDFVIRLKMPVTGITTINDMVQGDVSINNEILDDMIILRSDKTPTYMLSSVVDDFNMGITHIIRGDDHFNNAFRQIQIIKYLNWDIPVYAHIPLIHGPDGTKLSKRHGATNVYDYHKMGYTYEAMCNYLLRLGWSTDNELDYDISNAKTLFALNKINKSPAKFDIKKLNNINSKYLNSMDIDKIYELIVTSSELNLSLKQELKLKLLIPEFLKRINVFTEILDDIEWIINDDFVVKSEEHLIKLRNNKILCQEIAESLMHCKWSKEEIDTSLKEYLSKKSLKFNQIGPLLRTALTGKINSPDIITIIYVLGCEICLKRLNYNY